MFIFVVVATHCCCCTHVHLLLQNTIESQEKSRVLPRKMEELVKTNIEAAQTKQKQ